MWTPSNSLDCGRWEFVVNKLATLCETKIMVIKSVFHPPCILLLVLFSHAPPAHVRCAQYSLVSGIVKLICLLDMTIDSTYHLARLAGASFNGLLRKMKREQALPPRVLVLVGLPAAGKTTLAHLLRSIGWTWVNQVCFKRPACLGGPFTKTVLLCVQCLKCGLLQNCFSKVMQAGVLLVSASSVLCFKQVAPPRTGWAVGAPAMRQATAALLANTLRQNVGVDC